ncbi:MAG: DNA topoisomerase 3 [Cetobacterium sp.]
MKLIIAEKPDLARAIVSAISGPQKNEDGYIIKGDYTVTWAFGHLFKLKSPEEYDIKYKKWNLKELPIFFENWEVAPISEKLKQVNIIGNLLKKCDEVINAGDPDPEGQLLIDEILTYFKNEKPVKRVLINDNNTEAVKKAMSRLEDNSKYEPLGKSAYARAVSDFLVGINASRYFTLLNQGAGNLSVGRVQTPTLGLVVNRDLQIEAHSKEKYYELFLVVDEKITSSSIRFKYVIDKNNPNSDEDGKIKDDKILKEIQSESQGKQVEFEVTKAIQKEEPPLPFNLAKLQSYANTKFGYSPSETLDITQSLREKHKAITYNRSDSQYLNEEHHLEAPDVLKKVLENLGIKNLEEIDYEKKSKCFDSSKVTAHHAIIPTKKNLGLNSLTEKERNIYITICNFYIIQFLPHILKEKTEAELEINNEKFKTTSTKILEVGYKKYLKEKVETDKSEESSQLSKLSEGTYEGEVKESIIEEKTTTPPKRYTEATLIQDMTSISKFVESKDIQKLLRAKDKDKKGENGGIGTPATRATVLEILFKRGFIEKNKKQVISTELGKKFYNSLPDELKKPDMTAKWWVIQEEIQDNEAEPNKLIYSVLDTLKEILSNDSYPKLYQKEVIGICPRCGKNIYESEKAYYCEGFKDDPKCGFSIWKENKFCGFIDKESAQNFIKGEKVLFQKLKSKAGKEYNAYFVIEDTGSYINIKLDSFENKINKPT